jgi:uncharacterized membrane protein
VKRSAAPWGLVFVPLLFALICLPMALELIEPNGFYGVRIAATRASEAEWYRINRTAGIAGVIVGSIGFAANLLIARSGMALPRKQLACLAVLIGVAVLIAASALVAA